MGKKVGEPTSPLDDSIEVKTSQRRDPMILRGCRPAAGDGNELSPKCIWCCKI